jgi:hypothetical protein
MANQEAELLKHFLKEYSAMGYRLFRNNVGLAWTGRKVGPFQKTDYVEVHKGDILLKNARPFHGGFPKGSSDLIGFTVVTITPDMLGREMAIFTGIEVKAGKTKTTKEQSAWARMINKFGGIGVIAKNLDDVIAAITNFEYGGEDGDRH